MPIEVKQRINELRQKIDNASIKLQAHLSAVMYSYWSKRLMQYEEELRKFSPA